MMKKRLLIFLLSPLLLGSFNLMAQNWVNGGNAFTANGTLGTTTNFSVLFKTNNSERGRITNSGLWGIGTTAPNSRVHINSASGQIPFRAQVNGSTKLLVHSGGGVSIGSSTTPPANGLFVSGKVGIGTSAPDNTLHIFKGSAGAAAGFIDAPLVVENATNSFVNILAPEASETGVLFGKPSNSLSGGIIYNSAANLNGLRFGTNGDFSRMVIDNSGKVGIGTSSPSDATLVVNATTENNTIFGSNTTGISISPSRIGLNTFINGAALKNITTGFSGLFQLNNGSGALEFFSTPAVGAAGAVTAFANRMTISRNGLVGIGTFPNAKLHIGDPNDNEGLFMSKSGAGIGVEFSKTNTTSNSPTLSVATDGSGNAIVASSSQGNGIFAETGNNFLRFAGFFNGNVFSSGSYEGSDEKLKQNIRDFTSAMGIINELHPKLYQFKKNGNYASMHLPQGDHYGLIAQEVEKVLPNLVKETKFNTRLAKHEQTERSSPADEINFKALNYTGLIPILIKGMQEQDAKIEALTQLVNKLQGSSLSSGSQSSNAAISASLSSASLDQNIPNPLTNSTSIRYSIPAGSSKAQLTITDNNGNTVKQIQLNSNGNGLVNIETSTLSSGTYSYTLIVDGKTIATKKMVIAK